MYIICSSILEAVGFTLCVISVAFEIGTQFLCAANDNVGLIVTDK